MKKIQTLFDRDWEGNRGVIDKPAEGMDDWFVGHRVTVSEKLDGTNVRLTVRNGLLCHLEKRRNPTKAQKAEGIVGPWYVEATFRDPADKYIYDAAYGAPLAPTPDGRWSGEAIGPKIQGNPLDILKRCVVLFSLDRAPAMMAPTSYDELRVWLPKQRSAFNTKCPIEGIVWLRDDGEMAKIKVKDFK